jgi:hypothetical protein
MPERTGRFTPGLLRAVGSGHFDATLLTATEDPHSPWIAADLAVLDEGASDVGLEIDGDVFAAIGAGDGKLVVSH